MAASFNMGEIGPETSKARSRRPARIDSIQKNKVIRHAVALSPANIFRDIVFTRQKVLFWRSLTLAVTLKIGQGHYIIYMTSDKTVNTVVKPY